MVGWVFSRRWGQVTGWFRLITVAMGLGQFQRFLSCDLSTGLHTSDLGTGEIGTSHGNSGVSSDITTFRTPFLAALSKTESLHFPPLSSPLHHNFTALTTCHICVLQHKHHRGMTSVFHSLLYLPCWYQCCEWKVLPAISKQRMFQLSSHQPLQSPPVVHLQGIWEGEKQDMVPI